MDVALDLPNRRLQVTQVIQLVNTSQDPWDEVVLAVLPAHQPGVFRLTQAELTTRQRRSEVVATLDGIMLHLAAPEPLLPGEPLMITLICDLRVPRIAPETWLPEGNLGIGEHIIQAGDWHPTLAPYVGGEGWRAWRYHPVGDPVVYPAADYDVQITADPNVVIAAPGEVARDGMIRRYKLTAARSFAFLASPAYKTMPGTAAGIPLRAYYLPDYGIAAQAAIETAAQAIALYEEYYGPYPTTGLTIAQNAYWGSMEYSGLISLSDYAVRTYDGSPDHQLIALTAHEVAHQWWYGAVGNDQVHQPWLDEAFAKYSEFLYYERYVPELTRWWWATHVYRHDPAGPVDRTIYDFPNTPTYFNQLYGQAARFVADLRQQLGDDAFFAFLRAYQAEHAGSLVDSATFLTDLQSASPKDLTPLIRRYFSP